MTDAQQMIEALRALRPRIEARADEIEALGTIPEDLYDEIVATGYLRMSVPRRVGGAELTLAETNAVIAEAARADGAVGWLAMIAMHAPIILSLLPRATFDDLFASTPDVRARVVLAPRGTAVPVSGGYLVSGQWPFASGGPAPHLFAGGCLVPADDDADAGGMPQMVVPVLPADEVEFLDTWDVLGMKGTNSCDVAVHEVFVPEDRVANLFAGESCLDGPMRTVSFRLAVTPGHVAVALGIARGARDDLGSLAATKRSMMNPAARLGDDPAFQRAYGELAVHIEAADAMLTDATAKIWGAAVTGAALDPVATLQATAVAPYGTALCVKAIDAAYSLAGSASLYSMSPLQRRLRDIHVATQHAGVSTATYQALGAALVTSPEHGR